MYKNINISDENFDVEMEELCDLLGFNYGTKVEFMEQLPNDFEKQKATDRNEKELNFFEYISSKITPNVCSDCKQAVEKGVLTYQFKNGFMLFPFEDVV